MPRRSQSRRRTNLARARRALEFAAALQTSARGDPGLGFSRSPDHPITRSPDLGAIGSNVLTPDQISNYAASAGFSGDDLPTAVAVALAESGGNPRALGDGGNSVGLWQIYRPDHPEFDGWDLTDPAQNAQAAFQVYSDAGSFRPWTTFKTGAYQAHETIAQQGVMADARGVPMDPGTNDLTIATDLPASTKNVLVGLGLAVGAYYGIRWLMDEL